MLLNEYVLYVLEMLQQQNTESQYEAMLKGKLGKTFVTTVTTKPSCLSCSDECEGPTAIETLSASSYIPMGTPVPQQQLQSPPPVTPVEQQQQPQQQLPQQQLQQQPQQQQQHSFVGPTTFIKQEYQDTSYQPKSAVTYPPPLVQDPQPNSGMMDATSILPTPRSSFSSPLASSPLEKVQSPTEDMTSPSGMTSQKMFSAPFTHDTTSLLTMQADNGIKDTGIFSDMEYKTHYYDPFTESPDPLWDTMFNYGYEWNHCNMDTSNFVDSMPSPFLQSPIPIV